MAKIVIDGKEIEANDGEMLLDVALRNNVDIPHLCHNDEIKPYGACRLCLVEVKKGRKDIITTSCTYPISDGVEVKTNTEKVLKNRKLVLELLLARSPNVPEIQSLAKKYGVEDTRFDKADEGCILCGLCVHACEQVVGVSAISFSGRGVDRVVSSPFDLEADRCIGCSSCVYVCPTNYIKMEEKDGKRIFPNWHVEFEMQRCEVCGRAFAPKKQLEYFRKLADLPEDFIINAIHVGKNRNILIYHIFYGFSKYFLMILECGIF